MMNWVEKIDPMLAIVHATMVVNPTLPSQVKYTGASLVVIGAMPCVIARATPSTIRMPTIFTSVCRTDT